MPRFFCVNMFGAFNEMSYLCNRIIHINYSIPLQENKKTNAMTVITSTQFRANQSKYIRLAHSGERVVLSSRAGYAVLTPISEEDEKFNEYVQSDEFRAIVDQAHKDYREGKCITLRNAEEAQKWFDSL